MDRLTRERDETHQPVPPEDQAASSEMPRPAGGRGTGLGQTGVAGSKVTWTQVPPQAASSHTRRVTLGRVTQTPWPRGPPTRPRGFRGRSNRKKDHGPRTDTLVPTRAVDDVPGRRLRADQGPCRGRVSLTDKHHHVKSGWTRRPGLDHTSESNLQFLSNKFRKTQSASPRFSVSASGPRATRGPRSVGRGPAFCLFSQ